MFPDENRPIVRRKINLEETDKEAAHLFAKQVKLILHTCNKNVYWAALEKLELPTKEGVLCEQQSSILLTMHLPLGPPFHLSSLSLPFLKQQQQQNKSQKVF